MYRFFLLIFLIATAAAGLKKVFADQQKTEKVFEIIAGKAIMKISAHGGRIISFRLRDKELITNKNEHEIFGSTLWTAPQSDWGWPPFETLDQVEYNVEKHRDTLKMISKPDIKSGFQFEKTFIAIDNRFIRIEYCIRNISEKEKAVAAWEVTRVPSGGLAFFPTGEIGKVPESTLKCNLPQHGINWVAINKTPTAENQKLFATASEGWLGYTFKDVLFIKQFPDTKPDNYSPNQAEVEIYVNAKKSYAELENHGPYTLLQPGKSISYTVNWFLVPVPKKIDSKCPNQQLSTYLRKKINKSKADFNLKSRIKF